MWLTYVACVWASLSCVLSCLSYLELCVVVCELRSLSCVLCELCSKPWCWSCSVFLCSYPTFSWQLLVQLYHAKEKVMFMVDQPHPLTTSALDISTSSKVRMYLRTHTYVHSRVSYRIIFFRGGERWNWGTRCKWNYVVKCIAIEGPTVNFLVGSQCPPPLYETLHPCIVHTYVLCTAPCWHTVNIRT